MNLNYAYNEYREDQDGKIQSINHVMDDTKRIATIRDGYDFGDTTPKIKYNFDSLSRNLGNHLGSSNILVDDSGTLVNQDEYYPFGETSFGSYAKKRYRFCGKEKDEESGMYYYGARYYSPWLCRFISVDPLAAKYPFYTPYQYAGNQPINFIDLDGMEQAPPPTPSAGSSIPIPAVNNVNQKSSTTTTLQPGLAPNPNTLSLGTVKPKGNTPPPSKVTPPSTAFTPSQDSGANSSSNATTEKIQKSQQSAALASQKLQCTTQLSADFRPDDLRAKSADDAEMYISLQKIGDAVPLFGEFIKAGSYNAMGMPEQRNASLIKGTAEVALTVGLAYVAPEALTFATVEARGGAKVAAKGGVQAEKVSGSYLLEFQSGKFYAGKGLEPRMMQSINRIETNFGDKLVNKQFFPASSTREAFINEHNIMMQMGGPKTFRASSPTYNKIYSPGRKLVGF